MAIPHKAPLWDRETFGDGISSPYRDFFRNPHQDAQGRPKDWKHTSGRMPPGYDFFLYELAVLVDAGSDAAQAEKLWNDGKLVLFLRHGQHGEWPMRMVMFPPRGIPTGLVARTRMIWPLGGLNMTISGKPLNLRTDTDWHLRIECDGLEKLPVMILLKGIRIRAQY